MLELTRRAFQADQTLRTPHLHDAASILRDKNDFAFVNPVEYFPFDDTIAAAIFLFPQQELVIFDALFLQSLYRFRPVLLIPA